MSDEPKKRKHRTPEFWAKLKADYETGDYSMRKLAELYDINRRTIESKAQTDRWMKGRLSSAIEEAAVNRAISLFSQLDLPQTEVFQKIKDGIEGKFGDKEIIKYVQEFNKMTNGYSMNDEGEGKNSAPKAITINVVSGREPI